MGLAMRDCLVLAAADAALRLRHRHLLRQVRGTLDRTPRIADPPTYLEAMLWRKLVDRNPLFVVLTDKLACKHHIRRLCPALELPRIRWSGTDPEDLPESACRGDVYFKASHGWGMNLRIPAGTFDRAQVCALGHEWMRRDHGRNLEEWAYSQVPHRLFVEDAVESGFAPLLEFNIRAANGRFILGSVRGEAKTPQQWIVYANEHGHAAVGFESLSNPPPHAPHDTPQVREAYREAVQWTARLSKGVDYARYDFLWNGRTLYGGEITVYPHSGMSTELPLGALLRRSWDLRESHFLSTPQTGPAAAYAEALRRSEARRHGG